VDLYLEGSDQHRGWFQSSLIPSVALHNQAPYKAVLTHGFVVDGQGRKMSKSLGNVVSPDDIIKNNGADILRLWVASSSYNEDIRISKEVVDRLIDAYRKIRNTMRYLLGNLYDFDPKTQEVSYGDLFDLDQWALAKLAHLADQMKTNFSQYEFARLYKEIYNFCNEELSNFYLDILKDRLYISAARSLERKSAQTVLYHILNHLVRLVAPILTFTSEEIFQHMPKDPSTQNVNSVHLLEWLEVPKEWNNPAVQDKFQTLIDLRPFVMKALEDSRRDDLIGSSLDAKIIFETASDRDLKYLRQFGDSLADMFVVSQAAVNKVEAVEEGLDQSFAKTRIHIKKADGLKCSRSWKYSLDVGQDPDHPTLSLKNANIVREIIKEMEHGN
ncbi:MAG: class I tRNA ligase family protein, partial [Candidatus Omnitrophica bacterium]|nr:class I tRNA ligase family protein [Candidatus Omnitrophota bacterium]